MTKFILLSFIFSILFSLFSPIEARLRYQQDTPYQCLDCHARNLKDLTDTGLYFLLNGMDMKGWKPRKSEDERIRLQDELELYHGIAKLSFDQNKKHITSAYLIKIETVRQTWESKYKEDKLNKKMVNEFKKVDKIEKDMEKDVFEIKGKIDKLEGTKSAKNQEKVLQLYAQLEVIYGLMPLAQREIIRPKREQLRADKEMLQKFNEEMANIQDSITSASIEYLINEESYLSAKSQIIAANKNGSDTLKRKVFQLEQRLEDPIIIQKMKEEQLAEDAKYDFDQVWAAIEGKGQKRAILKMLQEIRVKYNGTIYFSRADELVDRIRNGEFVLK